MDASSLETFTRVFARNTCTRLAFHDGWHFFSARHKTHHQCDMPRRVRSTKLSTAMPVQSDQDDIEYNHMRTLVDAMQNSVYRQPFDPDVSF